MQRLSDIVAVSGLLLTLATFLFNLAWPRISHALNLDELISGDIAKSKSRKTILATMWSTVVPIFFGFLSLFYVNLPSAYSIITTSSLSLWNFDVDDTLFVMVVYALLGFVIFNGYLVVKLLIKSCKFK